MLLCGGRPYNFPPPIMSPGPRRAVCPVTRIRPEIATVFYQCRKYESCSRDWKIWINNKNFKFFFSSVTPLGKVQFLEWGPKMPFSLHSLEFQMFLLTNSVRILLCNGSYVKLLKIHQWAPLHTLPLSLSHFHQWAKRTYLLSHRLIFVWRKLCKTASPIANRDW
jgi:hypothetical protein